MLKYNHIPIDIKTKQDLLDAIDLWKESGKPMIAFDTESTGLHIVNDKPFVIQYGFIRGNDIITYAVDVDVDAHLFKQVNKVILKMAKCNGLLGHNIKYDLHMSINNDCEVPDDIHYMDTQIYIRAAHDALTPENGGPSLALKAYAARYIDKDAKYHEKLLATERMNIAKELNVQLKNAMYKVDKRWTLKGVDDFFKDVLNSVDDLPENVQGIYKEWLESIPEPIRNNMTGGRVESDDVPYNLLDRPTLIKYAHLDIYYTLLVFIQCGASIKARGTHLTLELEEKMIPALIRMERCGFKMDKEYIEKVTKELSTYLKQQRTRLFEIIGEEISVGQHAKIKQILDDKYHMTVKGTGKEDLQDLIGELKHTRSNPEALEFIELVQELRTLEKWYATYLLRFIRELKHSDRVYTQINQVGTVAGRVTSDFQQFPKYGINKADGTPLFSPRAMVIKSDDVDGIAYLDYSQIELRFQALYTILVEHPDLNLCRAYMPYKCVCVVDDGSIGCGQNQYHFEPFDYNNKEHIKHAYDWKWYYEEDTSKEWVATDVHAATTHVAFPDVPTDSDEFKKLRGKVGKRVNFAKNYGAQFGRIKVMFPDYDDETIHRIDDAYYKAFPGVKKYHDYCYDVAMTDAYVVNLFGVRYYGLSGHKLINALVQGSAAYFLKDRIYAVDKYIKDNNLKTRIQMQIHDELSFEVAPGEEKHIAIIQSIMQDYPDSLVPIVADLEWTTTSWADKVEKEVLE